MRRSPLKPSSSLLRIVLIAAAVGLAACPTPAEKPPAHPTLRLGEPIEIAVESLRVNSVAILADGETVALAGTSDLREDASLEKALPGGALVNLRTKKVEPFTNGHLARVTGVGCSFDGTRVVTGSTSEDKTIRSWDVKARKPLEPIDLSKFEIGVYLEIACFSRSNKAAVSLKDRVAMLDLAGKEQRIDFESDAFADAIPNTPTLSHDDKRLACETAKMQVVVWDVATKKVLYSPSLLPEGADYHNWNIHSMCFSKTGRELLVARTGDKDDVPKGTPEEKVPADQRGLFLIDIEKQRVLPLGMGQQIYTLHAALDPTDQWIATVGPSRPDKPGGKDAAHSVGELRVYHFPTRSLACRIQFQEFFPSWVGFTRDGKKLIAVDTLGIVRSWTFSPTSPMPMK